jgi:CheY-like chemotaxis protein
MLPGNTREDQEHRPVLGRGKREDMQRATGSTVLLIEPDDSLRRLITLGLLQRGVQVIAQRSLAALADQPIVDPDLLVLDIDNGNRDDATLLAVVQSHPYLATLPALVLAWDPPSLPARRACVLPLLDYLAKPFDARTLHATVANLLATSAAIAASPGREPVPASAATPVAVYSGLSPLVTAAGLLLTVIGLMLQALVVGAGLLVVLLGLLWWTLGRRPGRRVVLGKINTTCSPSLH